MSDLAQPGAIPAPLFSAAQRAILRDLADRDQPTYMLAAVAGPAFQLTLLQLRTLAEVPSDPVGIMPS